MKNSSEKTLTRKSKWKNLSKYFTANVAKIFGIFSRRCYDLNPNPRRPMLTCNVAADKCIFNFVINLLINYSKKNIFTALNLSYILTNFKTVLLKLGLVLFGERVHDRIQIKTFFRCLNSVIPSINPQYITSSKLSILIISY